MDDILKSLYLRLDANANNLTDSAIGKILVKIVYASGNSITKKELFDRYAKLNGQKKANEPELTTILTSLIGVELLKRGSTYYLSQNRVNQIKKAETESYDRKKEILKQYFGKLYSSEETIAKWLQDVTIHFFELFSDEWISDLVTGHHAVNHNESSIKDMVEKRTANNKELDKMDKTVLPKRFCDFVNDNMTIVNDYLWEYGTSAFAAKLIKNKHGVNAITLDAFKNSRCVLDTNILLFIALDSRYKDGIVALERVFEDLNIEVGYLYITKKEYQDKVQTQKNLTMHNLENYGYKITSLPTDDFTNYAKALQCQTEEDFERFFEEKTKLPKYVHNSWPIKLFDDDASLVEVIDSAQENIEKKNSLNSLYYNQKGYDKRPNALRHDIGLLEGVQFLRKSSKYFIISEEACVNLFSKERPSANKLPLAMRIETLINVLAVNNGGDTFEASNYVSLFANIIRTGMAPYKNTFKQEELYDLFDMDNQIAQLHEEEVESIVEQMHDLMLQGTSEKELNRTLKSLVTKGKIKTVSDLDSTKEELMLVRKQAARSKQEADQIKKAVYNKYKTEEVEKYDKDTAKLKLKYKLLIPLLVIAVSFVFMIVAYIKLGSDSLLISIVSGVLVNIISYWITNILLLPQKIKDRDRSRDTSIDNAVRSKMEAFVK